jgi:hypothetical protein
MGNFTTIKNQIQVTFPRLYNYTKYMCQSTDPVKAYNESITFIMLNFSEFEQKSKLFTDKI